MPDPLSHDVDAPLRINNFSVFKSRHKIVKNVTLPTLAPGTICSLLGPNGCGKTTLLQGLARLCPAQGSYHYGKEDMHALPSPQFSSRLAYLPQTSPDPAPITILDIMLCTLISRGLKKQQAYKRGKDYLSKVGLHHRMDALFDTLSGGQRQRVAIAQVLSLQTPIILLDEPLNNLDPKHQFHFLQLLKELAKQEKRLILVTLHDLNVALRLGETALLMKKGQGLFSGKTEDILTVPNIQKIYGVKTIIEHTLSGKSFIDYAPY